MLLDQHGQPINGQPALPFSFVLMEALLKAATKSLPFHPSPAAQVRQVASECAREPLPEEPAASISFRPIYG